MFTLGFEKTAVSVKWIARRLNPSNRSDRISKLIYDKSFKATTLGFKNFPRAADSVEGREARAVLRKKSGKMKGNLRKLHAALRRNVYDGGTRKTRSAVVRHVKDETAVSRHVRESVRDMYGPKGNA